MYRTVIFVLIICTYCVNQVSSLGRIVGGLETTIEKRPYQASLQVKFDNAFFHQCGASIISTKFLLTAAHCYPGFNILFSYARVGSTAYNSGGQLLKVAKFLTHPLFKKDILDYDFAIVSFNSGVEIKLGPSTAIVNLASTVDPDDGTTLVVSGWGVMEETEIIAPSNLREVQLPVFNREDCIKVFSFLTDRQICLGGTPHGGVSPCFGDSGGPAVLNETQYGLVSGGNSCGKPNEPGVFARISSARQWINQNTGV